MQKNVLFYLLIIPFIAANIYSQSFRDRAKLPAGLGLSNHFEYSFDNEKDLQILENWLNLDYTYGAFSAGFRFDVFQPNDPNPAISRGKENYSDISYKYIKAKLGKAAAGVTITVGNYYTSFGRGMILKSYEDRNIRIDNNLLGINFEGRYKGLKFSALSGKAENSKAERKDIIHAADLEYKFLRQLKLGATYAVLTPENSAAGNTSMQSIRVIPRFGNLNFYAEYGVKQNSVIRQDALNSEETFIGRGFYGSVNFYAGSFGISGEYKFYDNFAFTSDDGTIFYNTPPALRKDYPFILLNRHPSPLDADNEQGLQFEGTYSYGGDSFISISVSQTNTLDKNSYYQKINNLNLGIRTQLKELFFQSTHKWNSKFKTIAAFGYNEELSTNTKNISPVIEGDYYLNESTTLKFTIEHMHSTDRSTNEKYYSDVFVAEYLRSPKLTLSVLAEVQTKEPEPGKIVRRVWGFVRLGYKFWDNTDISLLAGSRQAGNICIGGVCRYEPEFSGVEIKMITTL